MPFGDGTGPLGQARGRGMGQGLNRGRGMGRQIGFRRGGGTGICRRIAFANTNQNPYSIDDTQIIKDEITNLETQIELLKEQLKNTEGK